MDENDVEEKGKEDDDEEEEEESTRTKVRISSWRRDTNSWGKENSANKETIEHEIWK